MIGNSTNKTMHKIETDLQIQVTPMMLCSLLGVGHQEYDAY